LRYKKGIALVDAQSSGKVVRNSTYLTIAYIIQKLLSFVYFVFYSRALDAENTGTYIFALSFATIFGIIVDLGLNPVLVREVARAPESAQKYLSNVLGIKGILALVGYGGMILISRLLGHSVITQELLLFTGLVMVVESFSLSLYGVFRGLQNFKYEATGTIIHQVVLIGVGVIGLTLRPDLFILAIAVVLGASANFLYAGWNIIRKLKLTLVPRIKKVEARFLLRTAAPFFLTGIFTKIYAYVDIVMLGQMTNTTFVGWYSVAYKLTYAIQFLPIAVSNSVYPALSEAYVNSKDKLRALYEQSVYFMFSLSLPIAVAVSYLAEPIITHPRLWPTFSESVPALQISVLGLPFIFINLLSATLLNATNRQKINILNIGLTMLCNIILNFIMIPHWQHVGSSFAALGSAIILFILNLAWIWKIFPVNVRWMLGRIWRVVFATLAMFALLVLLRDRLTIFLLAPIALVIYVIAFISVGGITRSEFQVIVDMIRRKKRGPNA